MKHDTENGMKLASANVDKIQVFVVTNNIGMKINVNVRNQLTRVDAIKDLFGILVIINVSVINRVMLEYIETMKILNAEKKLLDELIEEYSESINENEIISVNLNDYGSVCGSCTVCIVLFVIAFLMMIGISSAFIYFYWYLKKSNTFVININPGTETVIY